jgi:DNA replication protein DnaC
MTTIEKVKNKYYSLNFNAISSSLDQLLSQAEENEMSYLTFADLVVTTELNRRDTRRVIMNMKKACFPAMKRLEEFDFNFQTTITKKQIVRLLDFTFVDNRNNVIFTGPAGIGKTHLAIALGIKAVEAGYKVLFTTALELSEVLDLAEAHGELKKKITTLAKLDLLIIDELGFLPLSKKSVHNFFQLINAFYEYRSIIITTNKDFASWTEFFIDETVAVPIVDRVIHHSHLFMMGGESYRLKEKMAQRQSLMERWVNFVGRNW